MEIEDILNPTLFIEPEEVKRPEPVTRPEPEPVIEKFVSRKGKKRLVDLKKTCKIVLRKGKKRLVDLKKTCKIVLLGDTAAGKSCLIENYLCNTFSDDYEPTVLDIFRGPRNINGEKVELEIHDTSGDEHVASNRKVVYKDGDLFLLCCNSVQNSNSYQGSSIENIPKWI